MDISISLLTLETSPNVWKKHEEGETISEIVRRLISLESIHPQNNIRYTKPLDYGWIHLPLTEKPYVKCVIKKIVLFFHLNSMKFGKVLVHA